MNDRKVIRNRRAANRFPEGELGLRIGNYAFNDALVKFARLDAKESTCSRIAG